MLKEIIIPFIYVAAAAFAFWLVSKNRIEIRSLLKDLGITKLSIMGVEMSVDPLGQAERTRGGEINNKQLAQLAEVASRYLPGKRILWVDDEPHGNKLERASFRALGITVVNVLGTDEALNSLKRDDFDLLISDVGRGKDYNAGFEMLHRFNSMTPDSPAPPVILYHGTLSKAESRDQKARENGSIGATYYPSVLYASVFLELLRAQPSAYCQVKTLAEKAGIRPLSR